MGDITQIDWSRYYDRIDLVVGGSPCQSFSVAGNREGLRGESRLMYEYCRAVREIRPEYFLWENVPGALSADGGDAFRQLLDEMGNCGYSIAWRVLDAQFFGVPQRRRRVFVIGRLGDEPPAQILFEPDGVCGDYTPSRKKREELTAGIVGGVRGRGVYTLKLRHTGGAPNDGAGGIGALVGTERSFTLATTPDQTLFQAFAQNTREEVRLQGGGDICGALSASTGTHQTTYVSGKTAGGYVVRRLTPVECERLQGFPDNYTRIPYRGKPAAECPDAPRYKALGNSFCVPVVRWIFERIDAAERGTLGRDGRRHASE